MSAAGTILNAALIAEAVLADSDGARDRFVFRAGWVLGSSTALDGFIRARAVWGQERHERRLAVVVEVIAARVSGLAWAADDDFREAGGVGGSIKNFGEPSGVARFERGTFESDFVVLVAVEMVVGPVGDVVSLNSPVVWIIGCALIGRSQIRRAVIERDLITQLANVGCFVEVFLQIKAVIQTALFDVRPQENVPRDSLVLATILIGSIIVYSSSWRHPTCVGIDVVVESESPLFEVVLTGTSSCCFSSLLDGRKEDSDKGRNNRDDNQQFDQSKAML